MPIFPQLQYLQYSLIVAPRAWSVQQLAASIHLQAEKFQAPVHGEFNEPHFLFPSKLTICIEAIYPSPQKTFYPDASPEYQW